jgi:hypothetical protein
MQIKPATILILTMTGCASDPAAKRLPGVPTDESSRAGVASRNPSRPYGYDHYSDAGPATPASQRHRVTTFVYDAAGLITADYDVDDSGARVYSETMEYNAMGQQVLRTAMLSATRVVEYRTVYDSFGRVIRRTQDSDRDGIDNSFTVYTYGEGDQRLTTHEENAAFTEDSTYRYDAMGRITELKHVSADDDFNFTLMFTYDDSAHALNTIGTDTAGVYFHETTRYNDANLIESSTGTDVDPSTGATTRTLTTANTYDSGNLITSLFTSSGSSNDTTDRYEYHYGSCE